MDTELIFWIVGGILSLCALVAVRIAGEKSSGYVKWVRDWEEYR